MAVHGHWNREKIYSAGQVNLIGLLLLQWKIKYLTVFYRMNWLGMNMYMYAPKDDYKHRQNWRELYTPRELVDLRELTEEATRRHIRFVYALSPGLDIRFSDSSEFESIFRVRDYFTLFVLVYFVKLLYGVYSMQYY